MGDAFLEQVIRTYGAAASDRGYREGQWEGEVAYAERCLSVLGAQPPGRLLDLACGSGASTVVISLRGFDVVAIDCTPQRIDIARREAERKGANVQWLCQDMRLIDYQEAFDYVCLRDVVFGIFETRAEDEDLIRRIARATRRGGRCLFEVYDKEFSLRHGVEDSLFHDGKQDRFYAPNGKGLSIRLYSRDEWERMLAASGLRILAWEGWSWRTDPPAPPHRADLIATERVR